MNHPHGSPGQGQPGDYQNSAPYVGLDLDQLSTGSSARSHSSYEPQQHPGTPQGDWRFAQTPAFNNSSGYEPAMNQNCTSCFSLGCELHQAKNVAHEISVKLTSKELELDKCLEERVRLYTQILALEEDVKRLRDMYQRGEEMSFMREEKIHNLEATCSLLAHENRQLQEVTNSAHKNRTHSSISPVSACFPNSSIEATNTSYDALTETSNVPWGQESSSRLGHWSSRPPPENQGLTEENTVGVRRLSLDVQKQTEEKNVWAKRRSPDDQKQTEENSGWKLNFQADLSPFVWKNGNYKDDKPTNGNTQTETRGDWQNKSVYPSKNRSTLVNTAMQDLPVRGDQINTTLPPLRPYFMDGSSVLTEFKSDLFQMSEEYSLAHCVGSDFIMSSGIAVLFRKKFRGVPELLDQNKNPGQVAYRKLPGLPHRYVYYLVTKLTSTGKPSWADFQSAIIEWSQLCKEHDVKKIAIPKLGCGRDGLDWAKVRNLLITQFSNSGIEIKVCVIEKERKPDLKWNVKLCHSRTPLSMLDPRACAFVFIASKDRFITEPLRRLALKFGFTSDYSNNNIDLGGVYYYRNKATDHNVFGLVAKERHSDHVSYCTISNCLQSLRKATKRLKLGYIGFEAFDDPKFQIATRKIWTVIVDVFFVDSIEVHICWPEEINEKCWEEPKSR